MSKLLSLKLNEEIFKSTEKITKETHIPRNAYINKAVDFFNKLHRRKALEKTLRTESAKVSKDSLSVLRAFETFKDVMP
ncbi:MAG: hypothetical protein HYT97_07920 [Elusimicrobia bacterium]|nr:hypothetical protein [Elusimicrobiota bacterium]